MTDQRTELTGAQLAAPLGAEFTDRPHHILEQLRRRCPVARVTTPGGRTPWLLTDDEDVRAAFLDPRLSPGAAGAVARGKPFRALEASLLSYDPPEHTRIRRLAAPLFTVHRMRGYQPLIQARARELLTALPADDIVDLMAGFATPFSFVVMADLLGIPEADRATFHDRLQVVSARGNHSAETFLDTIRQIEDFCYARVRARIARPGEDLWSDLVREWQSAGDVSEQELVTLTGAIVLAGVDSVVQMLGICFAALLRHPELVARLRADPARVPAAVEEILRWDTPTLFSTRRIATADIALHDTVIPQGSEVLLSVAAANRDPHRHPDPDELDIDRPNAQRHVAFGMGPHRCLGAALARLELVVAVTELLHDWPSARLAIDDAELRWEHNFAHRRLAELPVRLTGRPST